MNKGSYEQRLKQVLIFDKSMINIERVLKSDLLYVLNNYMELPNDELDLKIEVDEFGYFELKVYAKAKRLKNLNVVRA